MKNAPKEIITELQMRGFKINERYADYGTGSISNFFKVRIYAPRQMTSIIDEKLHNAYYVEIEQHSEPGYIECDSHTAKQIYIREDKLVEWLISKNILTHEEHQERIEALRKRRCENAIRNV